MPLHRLNITARICSELDRAYAKHGSEPWSRHEFYGIIKEEFEEMWDEIKNDGPDQCLEAEIIQVAAMCFRFLETGKRQRVKKTVDEPELSK